MTATDTTTKTTRQSKKVTETTLDKLVKGLDKTPKNEGIRERYESQKANGVINPIVLATLLGVKPQMIYNYIRKGKFSEVTVENNSTQKRVLHYGEANTWAATYLERKATRQAKIEAELKGEGTDQEA